MSEPNQLWEDMSRLNTLYEELMWDHDDTLEFIIEGDRIIIYNKTLEEVEKKIKVDPAIIRYFDPTGYKKEFSKLKNVINKMGWRDKVLMLNSEHKWVQELAESAGLEGIPQMFVVGPNRTDKNSIFVGASEISWELFDVFEICSLVV